MDRRPLAALLALGLFAAPGTASAASLDELLAGAPATGTLSDDPADAAVTAQTPKGTLSDTPTAAKKTGGSSESSGANSADAPTASDVADALPFTGSDPRITLLLGVAALLAGAGLRLRTGDARDF